MATVTWCMDKHNNVRDRGRSFEKQNRCSSLQILKSWFDMCRFFSIFPFFSVSQLFCIYPFTPHYHSHIHNNISDIHPLTLPSSFLLSSHLDCSELAPKTPLCLSLLCFFFFLASSRLQDRLELSGHADVILFLTHNALDGGGQATGVSGEDEGVAVFAAAVFLQGAAGVGDGVVVVVGVNHPVVVTWSEGIGDVRVE